MIEKKGKYQQIWLTILIVICLGMILAGGTNYVNSLRDDLTEQAIQNVLTVTVQQEQAFDNFISGDRERLHSFADYFSQNSSDNVDVIRQELSLFYEVDATYSVFNLETGEFYTNKNNDTNKLDPENMEKFRNFTGSGVREPYVGLLTGSPVFSYYECFTYSDGVRGMIQKSYNRSRVSNDFSLSFYNDQGFAYVVNSKGDILLRSNGLIGERAYDNIFDVLAGAKEEQENLGEFVRALESRQTGSVIFTGEGANYLYTYVPVENVEDWYLVSIVREDAILTEANSILLDSQQTFGLLLVVLLICGIFIIMVWRTHRSIQYQEQLFDIFSTYLSKNTNDVYMMIQMDGEPKLEYLSPNVGRVLGIVPEDMLAETKKIDATNPSGEKVSWNDLKALGREDSAEDWQVVWPNPKTGERQWFLVNAYCTMMQGRRKLVMYISDRTKERRSEDNLSEALKLAQVASNAKTAFLSSVSHDIRTPMNAIIGFASLLKGEADNPDSVREYTQRIESASNHLLELINDVLDMNKIESGGTMLNLSEMALPEVIEEVNTIIRPQTTAKGQTFDIFASPLTYEHLLGDKLRINQILLNLLSNAVKYTPTGGTIQLQIEELPQVLDSHSRVRFTVRDNGMGMSEEYQKVIFEPFTREENELTHQIQGTGFGMALTKSLVDLMGGTIKVSSTLGMGSVFTVELEMRIQEQEDDPHFWTKYKVRKMIVADDEEEACQNVVRAMEKTGVVTEYATDGETAVRMMRKAREEGDPYDLILLDWKMPDLNGLETARLIRQNYPERIPILLFTAYDWGEIEQEAKEIGVDHFMAKPFFMSTFKESIRRIMGSLKAAEAGDDSLTVKGRNIMVVDDIEVNRIILVKILGTLGATCDVAGDGKEALEKFESAPAGTYDLILMDVQMPVMDGYAATRAIRASSHPAGKTVPIIAMTANAFVDDVRDAIESGMDAHVAKPIQLDKLKEAMQQVFNKREM